MEEVIGRQALLVAVPHPAKQVFQVPSVELSVKERSDHTSFLDPRSESCQPGWGGREERTYYNCTSSVVSTVYLRYVRHSFRLFFSFNRWIFRKTFRWKVLAILCVHE